MIFIEFSEPAAELYWKRWRKDCDAGKPTKADEVTDLYKRKSVKERFYFSDDGPFAGKCAYCETNLKDFQNPDIEHFRPKLGVTDSDDAPIMVDYGAGQAEEHQGYFWLAYDLGNLLPSCAKCNQPSSIEGEKIGKHNRFPVKGQHALFENEVENEDPLLLNPLKDNPADYLRVNIENGLLEYLDGEDGKGDTTIRVLGLNVRERLPQRRLSKIREVQTLATRLIHEPGSRDQILKELTRMKSGKTEYTAAARAILDDLAPLFANL